MSKPSGTNRPKTSIRTDFNPLLCFSLGTIRAKSAIRYDSGGNSNGDPPLPIPNREVKPVHAYDTAIPSGKVGSRQIQNLRRNPEVFFWRLEAASRLIFTPPTQSAPLKGYAACRPGAARLITHRTVFIYYQGVPDGGAWCALWPESQAIWRFSHGLRRAGYPELSSP